jgi:beta-phosphoglucomutase family hydrolase
MIMSLIGYAAKLLSGGQKNGQQNGKQPNNATISPDKFDAVLFDMDGVVTRTATVHFAAWKTNFDAFLKQRGGDENRPFTQQDYLDYVDGKPREDGVRSFLKSRQIELHEGHPDDQPGFESIAAIGRKKDEEFMRLIHTNGVEPYETTIALIKAIRGMGIATALVTASKNGAEILRVTNLTHLFDATVTGVDAANLHLQGKPAPDVFLEAARRLSVAPARAVVVEDAEAGVQSGKNGHFGLVIGVARLDNAKALKEHGADIAVRDLAEVTLPEESEPDIRGMAMADLDVTEANWTVAYDKYDPDHEQQRESLCSLGNGKFCTRGASADSHADDVHYPGTYVAGGYNSVELTLDDGPFENEELVNMPNWLCLTFKIDDGEWFSIDGCEILDYSQRLNLREGILYRDIHFRDQQGRETKLNERRFVHMKYSHLAGMEIAITSMNWSGNVTVRSAIDGTVTNGGDLIDPQFHATKHLKTLDRAADNNIIFLKTITSGSKLIVALAARTHIWQDGSEIETQRKDILEDDYVGQDLLLQLKQGQTVQVRKTCSLYTSRDRGIYEPELTAKEAVSDAPDFESLISCQVDAWKSLWRQYDLFIETTEEHSKLIPSLLLHLNSFHCLQTASTHTVDLDNGVPARGWSGEGYQGHVFWDDLFVFPFVNLRMPNISASLLKYRYRRLGEARKIAKAYGANGACFPWQSASDGKERTPSHWWMPATEKWIPDYTRLEIHVNGAIAYHVWQYYQVTADNAFMYSYGSEILLEIARFFASYAKFNPERNRYELHGVIGPDEFHSGYPNFEKPGVNNNAYTNIMAVWTLRRALELLEVLPADHRKHIRARLNITEAEINLWHDVSTKMFVPVMKNGVIAQFDGYEELEEFPGCPEGQIDPDELARLLIENSGYMNQYKICKQPDVLMLGFLFSPDELKELIESLGLPHVCSDLEPMADFYIPRTANGSTLSRVAHGWVLSRLDRMSSTKLLDYRQQEGKVFYEALGSDYYDVAARGTTKSGIHMGAMAGTVDIVQRCYTGIVTRKDVLWLDPMLPKQLVRLSFRMHYRGQSLSLDIHQDQMKIQASYSSASPIKFGYRKKVYELNAGETKVIALRR